MFKYEVSGLFHDFSSSVKKDQKGPPMMHLTNMWIEHVLQCNGYVKCLPKVLEHLLSFMLQTSYKTMLCEGDMNNPVCRSDAFLYN